MKQRIIPHAYFDYSDTVMDIDDDVDEYEDSDVPLDRLVQPGRMRFGRRRDHHDIADLERDPAHREDR